MGKRKGNYKFKVGELVRCEDKKAKVLDRWWDMVANNRYSIRFIIGKHQVGDVWSVPEKTLEPYSKES